jgi:hypothetical protein
MTTMLSIYDGQTCIGFVIERGKQGVELFDREQKSLGLFRTQSDDNAAISERASNKDEVAP